MSIQSSNIQASAAERLLLPAYILQELEKDILDNEFKEKVLKEVDEGTLDCNYCDQHSVPFIERVIKLREVIFACKLISKRKSTLPEELKSLFSTIINQTWKKEQPRDNPDYFNMLSMLVGQKYTSFINDRDLTKYLGHSRHLRSDYSAEIPEDQIKFEYWSPIHFLCLRINSLIIAYMTCIQENNSGPRAKLLEEVASELETLRNYHILSLIGKEDDVDEREKLQDALIDNIRTKCLSIDNHSKAYCLAVGYDRHIMYLNLSCKDGYWYFRMDNQGPFAQDKHRLDEHNTIKTKRFYPHVFRLGVSLQEKQQAHERGGKFNEFVGKIFRALKMDKTSAKSLLYLRSSLSIQEIENLGFVSRPKQITGNCVLANHDIGLFNRLGDRKLYEWVKNQEDEIIKSFLPNTQSEFFQSEDRKNAEIENSLQKSFLDAQKLEKKDLKAAFEKYKEAAKGGLIKAQFRVGIFLLRGMGCERVNIEEAKKHFQLAADNGLIDAKAYLIFLTRLSPEFSRKDILEALDFLAEQGNIYAGFFWACKFESYCNSHGVNLGVVDSFVNIIGLRKHYQSILMDDENQKKVQKRYEQAFSYFKSQGDQGDLESLFWMGIYYYGGLGSKKRSFEEAQIYFSKASLHIEALAYLGHIKMHIGKAEEGKNLLEAASAKDSPIGNLMLGLFYQKIKDKKAYTFLEKAYQLGNVQAAALLAKLYQHGEIGTKDKVKYLKFLEESAQLGDLEALFRLGLAHVRRLKGTNDYYRGFGLIHLAADLGNLDALIHLGKIHYQLEGNKDLAIKYFEIGVQKEHLGALYYYAQNLYEDKKLSEAFALFHKAAQLGSDGAQFYVGWCLWEGIGTTEDKKQAIQYLEQSSQQGNRNANAYLAKIMPAKASFYANKYFENDSEKFSDDEEDLQPSDDSSSRRVAESLQTKMQLYIRLMNNSNVKK